MCARSARAGRPARPCWRCVPPHRARSTCAARRWACMTAQRGGRRRARRRTFRSRPSRRTPLWRHRWTVKTRWKSGTCPARRSSPTCRTMPLWGTQRRERCTQGRPTAARMLTHGSTAHGTTRPRPGARMRRKRPTARGRRRPIPACRSRLPAGCGSWRPRPASTARCRAGRSLTGSRTISGRRAITTSRPSARPTERISSSIF